MTCLSRKAVAWRLCCSLCNMRVFSSQAQEILDRSCKGFFQQPFNLSKLSGKVREMLDIQV